MPTYRCQVVFPFFTNIPTDVMTNTLHFDPLTPLDLEDTADLVMPILQTFYNQIYSATYKMASYVPLAFYNANWYNLAEPPPRAPIVRTFEVLSARENTVIPTEVALVLSMQAPQVSGQPQARRRGRLFFGGVTQPWFASGDATNFPRWAPGRLTSAAAAATAFTDTLQAAGVRWSIWSPTDGASSLVNNGWIDNTPDTQRRRGVDATARTLWAEAP